MSTDLELKKTSNIKGNVSGLPSSKSVSNRVLILDALTGGKSKLGNLSEARDTALMQKLLKSEESVLNVMDAGTTMRFLTAFYSISGQQKLLTGTDRMKERPIAPLVNALRTIGADIQYTEKEGFPPVRIQGFSGQKSREVSVPGNLSSQFISALMMIGPVLPQGLIIRLEGHIGSKPYIRMTEAMMKMFSAKVSFEGHTIEIEPSPLRSVDYQVEPDWSAASYWYAFTSMAESANIFLPGNFTHSFQGDQVMETIGQSLGVKTEREAGGLRLSKTDHHHKLEWDFNDCPDLAQTVLPICAVKGITGHFTGLESLRIKETDRILALQTELAKIGAFLEEPSTGNWKLIPSKNPIPEILSFKTYHDHRMAMGLAPLCTLTKVVIEDPSVVNKSYPRFWEDVRRCGIEVSEGPAI
ncbi:MAG: 3-phosphoshikimate 1-carboxyvinyltransferase [Bacteroidetes bacterium]|nr:3-phosphoshikimate 1-carboxyvinyltransferase [Bacteroidota bacterium]